MKRINSLRKIDPTKESIDVLPEEEKINTNRKINYAFLAQNMYKQSWIVDSSSCTRISNDKFLFNDMENNDQICATIANVNV